MLGSSLGDSAATPPYAPVAGSTRGNAALLYNTALLGSGTAVLATLIGVPLGVVLARMDLPRKGTVRLALAAPSFFLPTSSVLPGFAGKQRGLVAAIPGRDCCLDLDLQPARRDPRAGPGLLSVVDAGDRSGDAADRAAPRGSRAHRREPAARCSGTSPCRWRRRASRCGAARFRPCDVGIRRAGLLRVRVFTTEVFTAFAALYDFGRAMLLAMPLLLLSMAVAAVASAVGESAS